ncbi:hypothetical protein NMY22_g10347 [Coprinellus aureogranulatus]|nr:hypothetical protein NMY22_g10347 [Coprinellus aureogranulatus]
MHLSISFVLLSLASESLLGFAAPIEMRETSESLASRELDSGVSGILDARDLLPELDVREWDELDELSTREIEDLELALRSLSDEDLLDLEARGLKGIAKLAKAAVTPIKKLASAIRPGGSRKASPAAKKPGKSTPGKSTSKKPTGKSSTGKSSSSGKKGSASKSPSSKKEPQRKRPKGGKPDKKSGKGTGKEGKKRGKGKGGKKGKKSDKKNPPSRTRNRTLNVNLDPGTLLNAGAAIANVVTGIVN